MAFTVTRCVRDTWYLSSDRRNLGRGQPRLERVIQAGGEPISWVSLACELQRNWARQDTVADVVEIVLTDRLRKE